MLGPNDLAGKRFLDIGCGSGLFSLAAFHLGATVHSFDYDPDAVACALELRRRFGEVSDRWMIEQGSVLDRSYLQRLGMFDVVYSWGVLHHTGALWQSLENAQMAVMRGGLLFIAVYNDQGGASRRWATIKRLYNQSPKAIQVPLVLSVGAYFEAKSMLARLMKFENPLSFKQWSDRWKERGMSTWHDLVDWTGGYPFEVAKPEEIFDFFKQRGFTLRRLRTVGGGHGCNEFVFQRTDKQGYARLD